MGGGDNRDAASLALMLEQQLSSSHSALRRGAFAAHAESAELVAADPSRAATPPGTGMLSGSLHPPSQEAAHALEQAILRAEKAEATVQRLRLELEERDLLIAQLRSKRGDETGYGQM